MKKLLTLLVVSAALVAGASAQSSTKIEKPFRAEIGLYIPEISEGDLGVNVGFGYAFYQVKDVQFAGVLRGNFFNLSGGGFDGDAVLTTLGIDARYQPLGQKFFAGIGLGALRADEHVDGFGSGNTTKLGYSLEAGYDFSTKLYGLVRYSGSTTSGEGFRGVTVGVGYRF